MFFVRRDNSGRGLIEAIFSIIIIIILSGVFMGIWFMYLEKTRQVAMENQLTNLRYSLELYMILEGSYPEDLRELNKRSILLKEDSLYGKRYLEHQVQDKEGYPVDPYGRRFIYDNKSGETKRRLE